MYLLFVNILDMAHICVYGILPYVIINIMDIDPKQPQPAISIYPELHNSSEYLDKIVNAIADPVLVKDENSRIIMVNDAFCSWMDLKREELLGLRHQELNVQEGVIADDDVEILKTGKPVFSEYSIKHPTRGKRDVITSKTLFTDDKNNKFIVAVIRDVTIKNAAEKKVLDISTMIRQIVDSTQEGIIVYDKELRYRLWNPFMEKLSGRRAADVLGKKAEDVFPFLRDAGVMERLEAVLQGETVTKVDVKYNTEGTGKSEWTSNNSYPLYDEMENIIGAIGSIRDITDQKTAENASQESHKLLERMSEQVPGVLYQLIMTPDGKISFPYASAELTRIFGVTPEEAKVDAANVFKLVHPEDFERMMRANLKSAQTMTNWCQEFRVVLPGNKVKTYLGNAKPEKMADGTIIWHGFIMDISDRKKDEVTLKENQERLKMTLNAAKMGEWTYDIAGGKRYFDEESCRLLGLDYSTFKGTPEEFFDVVHPDDVPLVKAELKRALEQDDQYQPEFRVTHPDGTIHNITARGRAIHDENGNNCKLSGLVWDMTERKAHEEEKIKIDRLESLGVLAGGIAHDFNNLLGAIMGNASLALTEGDQDEKNEMMQEIVDAAQRATSLTRQLLAFAKGGAAMIELQDAAKVITDSSRFALGKSSPSDCVFNIPKDLWPARIDAGQVAQLMQNLVINANQAMPEGGNIEISAKNIEVELFNLYKLAPGAYIQITVSDTGIGIPPKYISKIFDPYFSTKSKDKGTGLGLAVAYAVVQKHKGHIGVNSKQGEGTTFEILLPAEKQETVPDSKQFKNVEVMKGLKILVMDDEESIRKVLQRILTKAGYEIDLAGHGAEALEKYSSALKSAEPFDVVMLDLTVPGGMGGIETLRKLKLINPNVVAIVSSGYSSTLPEGFNASIPKPYTSDEIQAVLGKLMKQRK